MTIISNNSRLIRRIKGVIKGSGIIMTFIKKTYKKANSFIEIKEKIDTLRNAIQSLKTAHRSIDLTLNKS